MCIVGGGAQRVAAVPLPCSCVAGRGPSVYCYRPCVAVATFSIIFHLCHCLPFLPYIPTYSSIYHYFQFLPIPPTFCLVLCTIVSRFVRCAVAYSLPSLRSYIHSTCALVHCMPGAACPACCRPVHVLPACRRCPYSIYTTGGALARAYSCGGSPGVFPMGGNSPSLCAFSIIDVITYLFTDRPAFFAHFCRLFFVTLPPFFHCRVSLSNDVARYFRAAFSCASLVFFMDFCAPVYIVIQ